MYQRHVDIDLSAEIEAALSHFSLEGVAEEAKIYQVEYVVEVHNADATARVRNLGLFAAASLGSAP